MEQIKWFDRKFDFSYPQNIFPSILERLEGSPVRLRAKKEKISPELLELKLNGKWSIKENIGHLIDLEPLWHGRLEDIMGAKEYLREADLENRKTDLAEHNHTAINDLLSQFEELRAISLEQLRSLTKKEVYKTALHPRLEQPMRIMDLFLFVAEHDDHHLAMISKINATFM